MKPLLNRVFIRLLIITAIPELYGELKIESTAADCISNAVACLRRNIDEEIAGLSAVVVHEDVEQYSSAHGTTRRTGSLEANAEVIDGLENYTEVKQYGREVFTVGQISGIWSFGELATLLSTSRDALGTSALRSVSHTVDERVLIAVFHCRANSQRWFVAIDSIIHWLDFQGEIWMSAATGQVLRIRWTSGGLPVDTGVHRIVWTVSFKATSVGGRIYVLPESTEYRVIHRAGWIEWNVTRIEPRGRYGSKVWVSFGE